MGRWLRWSVWIVGVILFAGTGSANQAAAELKVRIELVWGTDDVKPADKNFKELDPKSRQKIRHFRWKNYWVVKSETTAVKTNATKVVLSERGQVELKDLGDGKLEIRLFDIRAGQPKFIKAVQHSIRALREGEYCILAGDDPSKWDDAWFVMITAAK